MPMIALFLAGISAPLNEVRAFYKGGANKTSKGGRTKGGGKNRRSGKRGKVTKRVVKKTTKKAKKVVRRKR